MAKLQKYDLMELPWTDVADYIKAGNDVVMIPVGSLEKHGNHVPLGVDSYTTMGSVDNKPLGTVKSRLARGRDRLRECLQGAWELLPAKYGLRNERNGK